MTIDDGESNGAAAVVAPDFVLDRRQAVPALVGRHEDFLIVTGLAGTAKDIGSLTRDGEHTFTMAGPPGGPPMDRPRPPPAPPRPPNLALPRDGGAPLKM